MAPGAAHCDVTNAGAELRDAALRFALSAQDGVLAPAAFDNGFTQAPHALRAELFSLTTRAKTRLGSSDFRLDARPSARRSPAAPMPPARQSDSRRGAARHADARRHRPARHLARGAARWHRLRARGVALRVGARHSTSPRSRCSTLDLDKAWTAGTTTGSPVVADDRFFGFEHPMAETRIDGRTRCSSCAACCRCARTCRSTIRPCSASRPPASCAAGFMAYLESERATPFRTFLHYNSWYDIGYFTPYTEQEAVDVIETVRPRAGARSAA